MLLLHEQRHRETLVYTHTERTVRPSVYGSLIAFTSLALHLQPKRQHETQNETRPPHLAVALPRRHFPYPLCDPANSVRFFYFHQIISYRRVLEAPKNYRRVPENLSEKNRSERESRPLAMCRPIFRLCGISGS